MSGGTLDKIGHGDSEIKSQMQRDEVPKSVGQNKGEQAKTISISIKNQLGLLSLVGIKIHSTLYLCQFTSKVYQTLAWRTSLSANLPHCVKDELTSTMYNDEYYIRS